MTRTRAILLAAWGVLAVGALVQLVRPDTSTDQSEALTEQEAAEQDTVEEGDTLAFGDGRSRARAVDSDSSEGDSAATGENGDSDSNAGSTPDDTTGSAIGSAGRATGTSGGDAGSDSNAGSTPDPAGWREVKIELDPEAYVATVVASSSAGHGVASLLQPEPGPVQHWFPSPTQFGGDRVFLVVDQTSSDDYIKVALPVKPNGQEGWIPRAEVEITKVQHRAMVDLSAHSLTVWDGEGMVLSTKAVTGKAATPTPLGTFYVRDIVPQADADGFFGPYVLALSGFSEVLDTFEGGLPALAVHGTDRPAEIGSERSAGCIRIPNDLITLLAESVPLGTPVTIVA